MKFWGMAGLVFSLLFTFSCGPGKTTQEAEDEQFKEEEERIQARIEEERSIYAPLEGIYRGTLTRKDNKKIKYQVELFLEPFSYYEIDAKRGKRREVPSIRGGVTVFSDKSAIFAFQFNQGHYDPAKKALSLKGGGVGPEKDVDDSVSFDGTVEGDRIIGKARTAWAHSTIDVKRVRETK